MQTVSPDFLPAAAGPDLPYPHDRFLRLPEVLSTCGMSRSTVYDQMRRGQFPAQVSLGGKNVAWLASEIAGWMRTRIASRCGGEA